MQQNSKAKTEVRQPESWVKAQRDWYIFADSCNKCGRSRPTNKYGICEFCDKVVGDLPIENPFEES